MFFQLAARNSRRSRKENGLFFSSLVISLVAFYIILALPKQDVMIFLKQMESDAVNHLMLLIPVFYGITLLILFFLIYYSGKLYFERRRHEFGVYLMLGMRRFKLFGMLLLEDLKNSVTALLFGLPLAVLLSELISLITARLVGIGIIGHQISFSPEAVLWTSAGFLLIKFTAFLILSGKISRQEIGKLLSDAPEGGKKQYPKFIYLASFAAGVLLLLAATALAVTGIAWMKIMNMGITLLSGILGMFLLFYGLRLFIGKMAKGKKRKSRLHVFNFRQIEETVICRSNTLAVCTLLILAAMCCFGAGTAIARFYGNTTQHVLDYTFEVREEEDAETIYKALTDHDLNMQFSSLFEMKIGHIQTTDDMDSAFRMDTVMDALKKMPQSREQEILLNNLGYVSWPYLISEDSYNDLLLAAGMEKITLHEGEAAVYMDEMSASEGRKEIMDEILAKEPKVLLDKEEFHLAGSVLTTNLVTDRSITLSFALILPEEQFLYYTRNEYDVYVNGVLNSQMTKNTSLMQAIDGMNQKLDALGLSYESYLQNMGRQLFYMVAASYLTIYLAIIFLIIANTMIGVQFLMGQQKSGKRYRTLVCLGAAYDVLCQSVKNQIHWYFGIPAVIACLLSFFGVRSLFAGLLSSRVSGNQTEMMLVSGGMIFVLCVVEWIYISVVKKAGCRYLFTLMEPERRE